jgi:hypothetical protein
MPIVVARAQKELLLRVLEIKFKYFLFALFNSQSYLNILLCQEFGDASHLVFCCDGIFFSVKRFKALCLYGSITKMA